MRVTDPIFYLQVYLKINHKTPVGICGAVLKDRERHRRKHKGTMETLNRPYWETLQNTVCIKFGVRRASWTPDIYFTNSNFLLDL